MAPPGVTVRHSMGMATFCSSSSAVAVWLYTCCMLISYKAQSGTNVNKSMFSLLLTIYCPTVQVHAQRNVSHTCCYNKPYVAGPHKRAY